MIPQIQGSLPSERTMVFRYPSFTYRDTLTELVGDIDGEAAIRQTVRHIVLTERYNYPIYPDNYGIELRKYIGNEFSFLEASIEKTLRDALLQDDRIVDVYVTSVEKQGIDSALVRFTTVYEAGTFSGEFSEVLNVPI